MAKDVVTIDDNRIRVMLGDPRYHSHVPCLAKAAAAYRDIPRICGRCKRKQAAAKNDIFNSVRKCLEKLQKPQQQALKQLTGARKIRIIRIKKKTSIKTTF
jgi:hypothetical protein